MSFTPYVVQFANRILIPSPEGLDALAANIKEDDGAWGCRPQTLEAMHSSLASGKDLNCATLVVLDSISNFLSLDNAISDPNHQTIHLFSWNKKFVTRAIYGSKANLSWFPKSKLGFGEYIHGKLTRLLLS
ncbi:hypothetical protein OCU04_002031 [Sclerotinia nivalis]|uniref:Uncharacterized protein n=1 Tax=Sclerotinia nivalis TaxID=352851 RepID=A0A9X0DR57_9HELO|nr:hypothetical protein OCU04_002031 [Sclerotinia nivalis]